MASGSWAVGPLWGCAVRSGPILLLASLDSKAPGEAISGFLQPGAKPRRGGPVASAAVAWCPLPGPLLPPLPPRPLLSPSAPSVCCLLWRQAFRRPPRGARHAHGTVSPPRGQL